MFTKITHLTVFVNNQDKALEFYKNIGFEVHTDADFGSMRWLTICLPERRDFEVALLLAEGEEKGLVGKQAGSKPLMTIETGNCEQDYERMADMGFRFVAKPEHQSWGISAMFTDLYGNLIYMCQSIEN